MVRVQHAAVLLDEGLVRLHPALLRPLLVGFQQRRPVPHRGRYPPHLQGRVLVNTVWQGNHAHLVRGNLFAALDAGPGRGPVPRVGAGDGAAAGGAQQRAGVRPQLGRVAAPAAQAVEKLAQVEQLLDNLKNEKVNHSDWCLVFPTCLTSSGSCGST